MKDILNGIGVALALPVGLALVFLLMWGAFSPMMIAACNQQTSQLGINHYWGFWAGCMVEATPGVWLPLENYRWMEGE